MIQKSPTPKWSLRTKVTTHKISHKITSGTAALSLLLTLSLTGCANSSQNLQQSAAEILPSVSFSADSAYAYVAAQVAFGPRVPGSESHTQCVEWIAGKMQAFGAEVTVTNDMGTTYDGQPQPVRNIVAKYRPDRVNRLLLCAHYDSRPFADQDEDETKRDTPISGANDGASGVAVLMEIGRQLQAKAPNLGVDIIFFDAEDGGTPEHKHVTDYRPDTWCIGSQIWAKSEEGRKAEHRFGILLDMVGGRDATFPMEMYSKSKAPEVVNKVWTVAEQLNYGASFLRTEGGYITDDHLYVNRLTNIPCIDIIDYRLDSNMGFCPTWHTQNDVLENIDRTTMRIVGETVLTVVYAEK